MRRRLAAVGVLLAVAVVATAVALNAGGDTAGRPKPGHVRALGSGQRTRTAHQPAPARRVVPRITGVGSLTLTLSESAPASIATGRSPSGQPVRVLPTVVRYPLVSAGSARVSFPLVVFSQGFAEPAQAYSGLMDAWAHAGYVVAAPTYPGTDPSAPGGLNEADIVNHPADLRFVISALRATARDPRSTLHGILDPGVVALAGQSDGGDVSLAVAANSCCRGARVKAAVILSGAELAAFGGTYYGPMGSVPLFVVQGTDDTINVPACSTQLYDQAPPPKYYLELLGAEHLPPYVEPGPTRTGIERATIAFLDAFLKHRRAALARVGSRLPRGETLTSAPVAPGPSGTVCPGAP